MQKTPLAKAMEAAREARDLASLLAVFDRYAFYVKEKPEFGVRKEPGVSIERTRREANAAAKAILSRVGNDPDQLTEADKAVLRQYSGEGGIGGSIHEYYTPQYVADGAWDAMAAMGFAGGNVLEPSGGTGVFHGTKPPGTIMTGSEIDATSSQINQLLHPEDRIQNIPFEQLATSTEDGIFDGVVGNVPFGSTRGSYGALDPEYSHLKHVDQYFVTRMLDKLKPGGLMVCVVPPRIVESSRFSKWRKEISRKGEFLGAHRLPSKTFANNGTDTVTDVLVMRKHSQDLLDRLPDLRDADLEAANVLWDTFIRGQWFNREGRRFIMGEQRTIDTGVRKILEVDGGNITQPQIKKALAHKFDSRIDWAALDAAQPLTPTYGDGDQRLMNGRWYVMRAGEWELVRHTLGDGERLDPATYGADSLPALKLLLQEPANALTLSYAQLTAIHRDFPRLTEGPLGEALRLAQRQEPQYRERIVRGTLIGLGIQDMLAVFNQTNQLPVTTAAELRDQISQEIARFGVAAATPKLATLAGGPAAGAWNAFVQATDVNGNFSDLLRGIIERGNTRAFDDTDAYQTLAYLYGQLDLRPVSLSDFADLYQGETPVTLEALAMVDGLAITPDGNIEPLDRAASGNVVAKSARIREAMGRETEPAILANYQRQLEEIERRRKRNSVDDIDTKMTAKWIPRQMVIEFLKDSGYVAMTYSRTVADDDGNLIEDETHEGADGTFSGYTQRGGKKRSNAQEQFERQLENYLNGIPVRSGDAAGASGYRQRIDGIEERFAVWLRQHDDIDALVDRYNDTFNGHVDFSHSDADLGLSGLSGEVKPFGYQNAAIRKLSEDGRGILAFGTGLGKTFTALGLTAYNQQMGRAKRTGIVVPKAVIENWYHETKQFYGQAHMDGILFVGVEPVTDKDGNIEQETVLDDDGQPKLNAHTGRTMTRDRLRFLSGAQVKANLNRIPQSAFKLVVMTKEQYGDIPMRPESVVAHVERMESAGLRAGKLQAQAKGHREAMKKEKFREKHSDTGTQKKLDIPYFEDMGFDSVIVDEGHNYRNSYQAGRNASRLAYLPTAGSAQIATDMTVKAAYLRKQHGGRGPVILTATPAVNSPIDVFNMLSHILDVEEWQRLGISDVDDFIEVFGDTAEVEVQKLSGEIEQQQALVGFKNLTALRSLIHRWVNIKDAKDVSETVRLPELEESASSADMTPEQDAIYEELRARADDLSKAGGDDDDGDAPSDSIFSIIRDMDRVATDLDLYHRTMTFRFPADKLAAVNALVADLPAYLETKKTAAGKEDEDSEHAAEKIRVEHRAQVTESGTSITLTVTEDYEQEVIARLAGVGIEERSVSHPVTPKYARLIENLRQGHAAGGKQIIFTEEKTQHQKLKRILVNALGIEPDAIGIINADTVAGKGKKDADKELAGLEAIATRYNEGQFRILICNKKAEVGVNLHHGTTDIHHLTLPWTPASITQRNGRGARVGAKQSKVRVHYYLAKGSFDEFRLGTLKRKASWMHELFTGDAERMANADADNMAEASLLLAPDPEERQRRIEENQRLAREKVRQAAMKRASIDLHNYIKAAHDMAGDASTIRANAEQAQDRLNTTEVQLATQRESLEHHEREVKTSVIADYHREQARETRRLIKTNEERLARQKKEVMAAQRQLARLDKAESQLKRLRPEVERAIKSGVLDVPPAVLDQAANCLVVDGQTFQVGKVYSNAQGTRVIRLDRIDSFDQREMTGTLLYTKDSSEQLRIHNGKPQIKVWPAMLHSETSYSPSELEIMAQLMEKKTLAASVQLLDRERWTQYLAAGILRLQIKSDRWILHNGDEFEIKTIPTYDEIKAADAKRAVYPDPNDSGLKAKLARWLLNHRDKLTSYSVPEGYLTQLYGEQYLMAIESHGNAASEQQVNEWLGRHLAAWLDSDEGKSSLDKALARDNPFFAAGDFGRMITGQVPAEFDNRSAFEAAIQRGKEQVSAVFKERQAELVRQRDILRHASYRQALTDSNAVVRERLEWLRQTFGHQSNGFSAAGAAGRATEGPYFDAERGLLNLGTMVADMVTVGALEPAEGLSGPEWKNRFDSGYYRFHTDQSLFAHWINPPDEQPAPAPEEKARLAEAAEAAAELLTAVPGAAMAGIEVRKNSATIQIGGGKYRSQGAWRSRKTHHYAAGEVLGLHDPKGKDGKLYAVKETLKDKYGRDRVHFATDPSSEFAGAWWFIPAEADMTELTAIFEDAA